MRSALALLLLPMLLAASCEPPAPVPDEPLEPMPGVAVDAPVGTLLSDLVWLPDGWIYFRSSPQSGGQPSIWRTRPDGGKAEKVKLPDLDGCRITRYDTLNKLPDGRLGAERRCMTEDARNDWHDQVAFDPATGTVEQLARTGDRPLLTVEWAPGLKTGYATVVKRSCHGIARLDSAGVAPIPGPVRFDGTSWPLEASFFETGDGSGECERFGAVARPRLLADGKTLLLAASPTSMGKSGANRTNQPWFLYRWMPGTDPVKVAGPLSQLPPFDPGADGRSAIVVTHAGLKGTIWRIDLSTGGGKKTRLADNSATEVALSPDGRQVAILARPYLGDEREQSNASVFRMEVRLLELS